jgi:hypothetical protein
MIVGTGLDLGQAPVRVHPLGHTKKKKGDFLIGYGSRFVGINRSIILIYVMFLNCSFFGLDFVGFGIVLALDHGVPTIIEGLNVGF